MAFKPNQITKQNVLDAVQKIENENIPLNAPTRWYVEIKDKKYPPKEVMRYAHEQMNGEKVWEYGGGDATNKYLIKWGFKMIDLKANPLKILISKYKTHIAKGGLEQELYKWKLINQYIGRPNTNVDDFVKEIKDVNFSNLIYPVGITAIYHMAADAPEAYKACFNILFDETKPLRDRINYFDSETLKIFRQLVAEKRLSHHQDERTMATFLTYHNPDKYTFYKNSFYQSFCDLLNVNPKKKGEKYVHYLELIEEFINEYIVKDQELIEIFRSKLPDNSFKDKNFKILAQDILYQGLDINFGDDKRYWRIGTSSDDASYWEIMKTNNKICIGWSEIGDLNESQIKSKKDIIELLKNEGFYDGNNSTISRKAGEIFNFYKDINVNDIILAQDGSTVLGIGIVTDEYVFEESEDFAHQKQINWKVFNPNFTNDVGLRTTVYELSDLSLKKQIDDLLDNNQALSNTNNYHMALPLNQILFGPPGTGKTYNTINKAIEIINPQFNLQQDRKEVKKEFDKLVKEKRIVFTTFHQSLSYEDFIEGIKPVTESGKVTYEVIPGIFKNICETASSQVSPNFELAYEILIKKVSEQGDYFNLHTTSSAKSSFWVMVNKNGNLSLYTTANKNYQGSMTKENFQKYVNGEDVFRGWEGYAAGVIDYMKKACGFVSNSGKIDNTNKKYVIIIDEINRGNVSQIFGELITLIEEDKRSGNHKESLEVTLPYSKELFSVPPNLHIIGTMNTADRSVEALDTALRRRFSFEEMPPNYALNELDYSVFNYKASEILKTINSRIEKLLDKDHAIGHSFFIIEKEKNSEQEIIKAFYKNIIPLLQEYFFGDHGKIGLVLGKGFINLTECDKNTDGFADFDHDSTNDFEEREVYTIIDYRNRNHAYTVNNIDMTFDKAIKLLMKDSIA